MRCDATLCAALLCSAMLRPRLTERRWQVGAAARRGEDEPAKNARLAAHLARSQRGTLRTDALVARLAASLGAMSERGGRMREQPQHRRVLVRGAGHRPVTAATDVAPRRTMHRCDERDGCGRFWWAWRGTLRYVWGTLRSSMGHEPTADAASMRRNGFGWACGTRCQSGGRRGRRCPPCTCMGWGNLRLCRCPPCTCQRMRKARA